MIKMMALIVIMALSCFVAFAQDAPTPEVVELAASDGATLAGDYYPAEGEARPAVLLLHQNSSSRAAWAPLVSPLLAAGYDVLAVDLRGFGDSGRTTNWALAQEDVTGWLDWLRGQEGVRPEAVSIVGASIGSNLALIGCADDEACVTAVALSPGLNYFNVMPETAVTEGLRERSALLIAAQADRESSTAVKQMATNARGEIGLQLFTGSTHGTSMLSSPKLRDRVIELIVDWLDIHTPEAAT